jgi:hypothetical protein
MQNTLFVMLGRIAERVMTGAQHSQSNACCIYALVILSYIKLVEEVMSKRVRQMTRVCFTSCEILLTRYTRYVYSLQ